MQRSTKKRMAILGTMIVLTLLLSGCYTTMTHARFPASIVRGSLPSGPNQWFVRTALTNEASEGVYFRYVVFLHVPEDWTLPWATQYSFTGDFQSTNLSQSSTAQTWITSGGECDPVGGAASSGWKWRAFVGPVEQMPVAGSSRFTNRVNLRGGLGIPSGESASAYSLVRVVTGVMWDSDANNVPDLYQCQGGANTTIVVLE